MESILWGAYLSLYLKVTCNWAKSLTCHFYHLVVFLSVLAGHYFTNPHLISFLQQGFTGKDGAMGPRGPPGPPVRMEWVTVISLS